MEDSDDEDVLMENSPLYNYLKEACPEEDFLRCQTTSTHPQLQETYQTEDDQVNPGKNDSWSFGISPSKWMARLKVSKQQDTMIMAEKYLPCYVAVILGSKSMFEDDIQLVMMHCNERIPISSTYNKLASQDTGQREKPFYQTVSTLGLTATIVGLLAGGYRAVASESDITACQLFTWFALLGLCLTNAALYSSAWWVNRLLHRQHTFNIQLMEQLMRQHDKYDNLLRKCIRYLQEIEVISRGFTLATPFTPASRLESLDSVLSQQQCPLLREVCFQTCKHQIAALKQGTLRLLQDARLLYEVDGAMSYLAKMDFDKIIPWLSAKPQDANGESDVEGAHVTRSLAILKVMYDLYIELKSEFFRQLVLCVCPDAIQHDVAIDVDSLQRWHRVLSEISATSQKTLSKLEHSYEWHKERPTSRRKTDDQSDQYRPLQVKWTPAKHLTTAVHSLRLHLDVALSGTITAEEHISDLTDDVSNPHQLEKTCKVLENLLEGANEKLKSSQSCLQQASMLLAKLQGKPCQNKIAEASKPDSAGKVDPRAELAMTTLTMPVAPEDMEFEDLIYEADMADEDDIAEDQEYDTEWHIEEKARRKQEAQETKHLLQELHTVLGQRAKEREQRTLTSKSRLKHSGQTVFNGTDNADVVPEKRTAASVSDCAEESSPVESSVAHLDLEVLIDGSDKITGGSAASEDGEECNSGDGDKFMDKSDAQIHSHPPFGLPQPAVGLPFMTAVAAQAARESKLRGAMMEETFGQDGDSSSSEDV